MNLQNSLLQLASVLVLFSAPASSLNLFELQAISNFPTDCASAYRADISSCTLSEVTVTGTITSSGAGVCSLQCLDGLSAVNTELRSACTGIRASEDTLIGLFFADKGIEYLCPNSIEGSDAPAPSSTGEDSSAAPTSSSSDSETESSTSASNATPNPSSSPPEREETTIDPPPSPSTFQPITAVDNGVATVITSEAHRTEVAKTNADAFGGGGSPFEVAANGAAAAAASSLSARRRARTVVGNELLSMLAAVLLSGPLLGY